MLLIKGPVDVASSFDSLGIPLAGIIVWLVIAIKVITGLAIILGYRVGLAAAALILFTCGSNTTKLSSK